MAKKVLTQNLSEPIGAATAAKFDIHTGDGNLTIDSHTGGEPVLASGTLQYLEGKELPTRTLDTRDGQATLSLRASSSGQPWFHFPWSACNGATVWQIHLNPDLPSELAAYSGGGNVGLDLASMHLARVSTDTGGGNLDVVLPDRAADLCVTARSGAGNVSVAIGRSTTGSNTVDATSGAGNVEAILPSGIAARIIATTGLGKVIIDPRFSQTEKNTYQSPDYDSAADKVEITLKSGAGNVSVITK